VGLAGGMCLGGTGEIKAGLAAAKALGKKALSKCKNAMQAVKSKIAKPPKKRGRAPVGQDGHPVELHHQGQKAEGPLKEMTRTERRLGDNYTKNHPNTGESPSEIERAKFRKDREEYWKEEWDAGRFHD